MISKFELVQEGDFRRIKYLVDFWSKDASGFSIKIAAGTLGGLIGPNVELVGEDMFISKDTVIEGHCKIGNGVRLFDSYIKVIAPTHEDGYDPNWIKGNVVIKGSNIHAGRVYLDGNMNDAAIRIIKSTINVGDGVCFTDSASIYNSTINSSDIEMDRFASIESSTIMTTFMINCLDDSYITDTEMEVASLCMNNTASIHGSEIKSKRTRFDLCQDSTIHRWNHQDVVRNECLDNRNPNDVKLSGRMKITEGDSVSMSVIGVRFEDQYYATMTDNHISIGCQHYTIEEWEGFKLDDDILGMDGRRAVIFWQTYRDAIIAMFKARNKEPEVFAQHHAHDQEHDDCYGGYNCDGG